MQITDNTKSDILPVYRLYVCMCHIHQSGMSIRLYIYTNINI